MRISRNDLIAGLPAIQVRDALRGCKGDGGFYGERLTARLGVSPAEGAVVLDRLVADGYVEPFHGAWRTTLAGNALTNANASKPVSRAKAQEHYDAFLARVGEVNSSERFLFGVEQVILFGSFLDPAIDPVGDVDLAVKTAKKPMDGDRVKHSLAHAQASGRQFGSFIDELGWPETEVWMFLRNRSKVLALVAETAWASTVPHRVVYTATLA